LDFLRHIRCVHLGLAGPDARLFGALHSGDRLYL